MVSGGAFLFMWEKEREVNRFDPPDGKEGQDLGSDETVPGWHSNGHVGDFDATMEEVLHLITHVGYATVYPDQFGEYGGTALSDAMDIARGGIFTLIPEPYPNGAWYSYDDDTFEYDCLVTEYFYWSLTSLLGAQTNRLSDISQEWDLNTKELLEQKDPAVYSLLTNVEYLLPTILPDGTYKR
jgi:hypothetical protein